MASSTWTTGRPASLKSCRWLFFFKSSFFFFLSWSKEHVGLVSFNKYGFDCVDKQEDQWVGKTLLTLFLSLAACIL